MTPARAGGFAPANRARGGENQAYGPTGRVDDNGATGALSIPSYDAGLTMEGWVLKAGNNGSGVLFGFGDGSYYVPTLAVVMRWGELAVVGGLQGSRTDAGYGRPGDCWHHVAVVFPPGFDEGEPWRFYLDGERQTPESGLEVTGLPFTGSAFGVGRFSLPDGARMAVDEVRV